jgi:hypothetical protein
MAHVRIYNTTRAHLTQPTIIHMGLKLSNRLKKALNSD